MSTKANNGFYSKQTAKKSPSKTITRRNLAHVFIYYNTELGTLVTMRALFLIPLQCFIIETKQKKNKN